MRACPAASESQSAQEKANAARRKAGSGRLLTHSRAEYTARASRLEHRFAVSPADPRTRRARRFTRLTISAPRKAAQKPSTLNPIPRLLEMPAVIQSARAFTTK